MDLDPIRRRLLELLEENDTDLKNVSLALKRNAAYLHQFVYRGTPKVLPEDVRAGLSRILGVPEPELKHGTALSPIPSGEHAEEPLRRRRPAGFREVPEIDVKASAGGGSNPDDWEERTIDVWLFPDPVIRHEFRTKPNGLCMLTIHGDSMEPMLSSGDRILIDKSQQAPVPPGIFVIWDGMGLVAKRLEHVPNSNPPKLIIKSVNPAYQDYERSVDDVRIIGRVIWSAKRL